MAENPREFSRNETIAKHVISILIGILLVYEKNSKWGMRPSEP